MTLQSLGEVIAARVIAPAQMREKMPIGDELGERFLDVTGSDQADMPLRDLECADQRRRHHEIAEPDIGCHRLRERADIEHAAMAIEALQGRHRPAVIVEFAVVIVLDDPGLAGPAEPPLQLLIWQVLVATIVLTGSALIADGLPHAEWSWWLVLLFLYSGLIGTALAYWAMSMVNKSISALTTSLGTTGTPLVGIASAAILLGEPLDISLAVAAGLIVAGIGLATLGDRLLRRQATASG